MEGLPHIGPVLEDRSRRDRFEARELAVVLSHYDLGVIDRIRVYPRGSRRSPKLRIRTDRGEFLIKRRAVGRDDPDRVAFAHGLVLYLAEQGYPVPRLIATRPGADSMLRLDGRIYEMFEYIQGRRYDQSLAASEQAGVVLGGLHRLLAGYKAESGSTGATYHAAGGLDSKLARIADAVRAVEPQADRGAINRTCTFLREAYHRAADRVERAGFARWPTCILHGDWHPGNLIYQEDPAASSVVAVLDFDSARQGPRMTDVANAVLQFSMEMDQPDDPSTWPDGLNPHRMRSFLRGYDQAALEPVGREEREALAGMIIEALIVESVVPIAATGRFSRIPGSSFLEMVERKVRWIGPRAATLVEQESW